MLKEKRVEVEGGISKPQYRSIHVSGLCGFLNQSYWFFSRGVYSIGILREYFDKNNLKDFKRLCGIVLILCDFKRFFLKEFLQ